MAEEGKSFWSTVPGVLTAIAGFIGAVAALLTALSAFHGRTVASINPVDPTPTHNPSPIDPNTDKPVTPPDETPHSTTTANDPQPVQLSKTVFTFPGMARRTIMDLSAPSAAPERRRPSARPMAVR